MDEIAKRFIVDWVIIGSGGYLAKRFLGESVLMPIIRFVYSITLRPLIVILHKRLIKSERDFALYLHVKNKQLSKIKK